MPDNNERGKGILYVMSTVVEGVVKIGRTTKEQFEERMRSLEKDGYHNVGGLKRIFAIEVNNCKDKERLLHSLFSRSVVGDSELFSLDVEEVASLLSSFDGEKIFPYNEKKEQVNEEFLEAFTVSQLPDGDYNIESNRKNIKAQIEKKGLKFIIKKGSVISKDYKFSIPSRTDLRKKIKLAEDGVTLREDYLLDSISSVSAVASIIYGSDQDGWRVIKDSNGILIGAYRKKYNEEY